MQSLARLMLLIAALAYGAMPMTGMPAMPVAHEMSTEVLQGANSASSVEAIANVDCPHSGNGIALANEVDGSSHGSKPVKITSHCSACLTLPASISLNVAGKPARAAEASALPSRLVSQRTAPLTPPPRA